MEPSVPCEASWGRSVSGTAPPALSACSPLPTAPLQNYRKSSRHLTAFISKFVQFAHKYIACSAPAAVAFLQKHSDVLQ